MIISQGTIQTIQSKAEDFPEVLQQIPDPPKALYVRGSLQAIRKRPCVAIVGSRKVTSYGRMVTAQFADELARAGVVIVSGLAFGVDAIAHRAALEAGGITVAVLAGGLDTVYPSSHSQLAEQIINQGGALLSEYPAGVPSYKQHFIARNRIVSGLSRAVLITEATEKSGTLHTVRFALEQGKDVLVVPGNITSPTSAGTNNILKTGATPITCAEDLFHALDIVPFAKTTAPKGATPEEQTILDLLATGEQDGATLQIQSGLTISQFNQTLTMLEITGKIRSLGANQWVQ